MSATYGSGRILVAAASFFQNWFSLCGMSARDCVPAAVGPTSRSD